MTKRTIPSAAEKALHKARQENARIELLRRAASDAALRRAMHIHDALACGLTKAEVARRLGISPQAVGMLLKRNSR